MTLSQQLIIHLRLRGFKMDRNARSTKYLKFDGTDNQGNAKTYWVGKNGALRTGRTVGESISIEYSKEGLARIMKTEKAQRMIRCQDDN